jgi:hypothetical protein
MTHKTIEAASSHSFSLDRFCVKPELLGARHDFTFAGKSLTIQIPADQDDPATPHELRSVTCYMWRTEGRVPLEYQVRRIAMRIAIGRHLSIPEEALVVSPRRDELFTKTEKHDLQQLIDSQADLAHDAFRYWLSVLRWKSGVGTIGEPEVKYAGDSGGGAALQESSTGRRFWLQGHRIAVPGRKAIGASEWQLTRLALDRTEKPHIWFEFLFEGEQRINNADLMGAVLSLAVAFEAIVRTLVTHGLSKQPVEPVVLLLIDRTNLRSILNQLKSLSFWSKEWSRVTDFSAFNDLMNQRDGVMHSGKVEGLDANKLKEVYRKLKSFAYFASEFLEGAGGDLRAP